MVGVGGSGKSELLADLEADLRDAGRVVHRLDGRRSLLGPDAVDRSVVVPDAGSGVPEPSQVPARSVLLVDDAHRLDPAGLAIVLRWWADAAPRRVGVVLTRRPGVLPSAALAAAEEGVDSRQRLWLAPMRPDEVRRRLADRLLATDGAGRRVDAESSPPELGAAAAATAAALTRWCAGSPRWLDRWVEACHLDGRAPWPPAPTSSTPLAFLDDVRRALVLLSEPAAAALRLWVAMAGPPHTGTGGTGGRAAGASPDRVEDRWWHGLLRLRHDGERVRDELDAAGLLHGAEVVPAVATALLDLGAGDDAPQQCSLLLQAVRAGTAPGPGSAGADAELVAQLWDHSLLPGHADALDAYELAARRARHDGRPGDARRWLETALARSTDRTGPETLLDLGPARRHDAGVEPEHGLADFAGVAGPDPATDPAAVALAVRRRTWARLAARLALDDGDAGSALRLADAAGDPAVVAALSGARGWWAQAAEQYRELAHDPRHAPLAHDLETFSRLARTAEPRTGRYGPVLQPGEHTSGRSRGFDEPGRADPGDTTAPGPEQPAGRSLFDRACRQFVAGTEALHDGATALQDLTDAADVLGQAHPRVPLPETPHAVAAIASAASCDATRAELLLRQARTGAIGGRHLDDRHDTLLAWVLLRVGRLGDAATLVDGLMRRSLAPRDRLVVLAVGAALARRASSLTRQQEVWRAAEATFGTTASEPWTLPALAELAVVGVRLGDDGAWAWLQAQTDLRPTSAPTLWSVAVAWGRFHAAIAGDRAPHDVERSAATVERLAAPFPPLVALSRAAGVWSRLHQLGVGPGRAVERPEVEASCAALRAAGLGWDAAQLASHAAVRCDAPVDGRALLELARRLRGELSWTPSGTAPAADPAVTVPVDPHLATPPVTPATPVGPGAAAPTDPALLSLGGGFELTPREREVAVLFLEGHTYKEMSALLFTSVKTLERHVTNMRAKIGARDRASFIGALRDYLAQR